MNNIEQFIKEFANKIHYSNKYSDVVAKNILIGNKMYSLNSQPEWANPSLLPTNIKESVHSYTRTKDIAIAVYKDLLKFLADKGITLEIEFPPISVSNTFERLMFMAKYLQTEGRRIEDLEDILWIDNRTLQKDWSKLSGSDGDPIQINGKPFTIKNVERHNGQVTFLSTAHPIFITPNLTQVIVMLQGLKVMAAKPEYTEYAEQEIGIIWSQLSDYAKARLKYVFEKIIIDDYSWYEEKAKSINENFVAEVDCSGFNVILDCLKNEKSCYIEYLDNDSNILIENCLVRQYNTNSVTVELENGEVKSLKTDSILRSAYRTTDLL